MSEPKRADWDRMAAYIHSLVRADPWVTRHRVRVAAHAEAIWLQRGTYGEDVLKAEIASPEWWLPLKQSHGREIAERLLRELKAKVEAIPRRGPDGWLAVPELGIELGPGTRISGGTVYSPGRIVAHEGHHSVVTLEEALARGWARRAVRCTSDLLRRFKE